jgi:cytolysin-activating lysine-acyltransferase
MGSNEHLAARAGGASDSEESEKQLLALGRLSFLAAFCPLHRSFPGSALARIFIPAINNDCVRFFQNEAGQTCAALIWARLSEEVSTRMLYDRIPPDSAEWAAGSDLWFVDILAPFDHGRIVARHVARNPPPEPFRFARLGPDGKLRKIVRGDSTVRRGRVQVERPWSEVR